jgi:thioredoxin-related protein
MKSIVLGAILVLCVFSGFSQDLSKFKLYNPAENAEQKIEEAVNQAKKEGKHVFIQVGGNWCIWCMRLNDFVTTDKSIDSLIKAN